MTTGGPLALFFACLVSGVLVPLPEDVALLVAGWETTQDLSLPAALAAGTIGVLGRDLVAFGLGRLIGPRLEGLPRVRRFLGEARLARAHGLVNRHGTRMLFVTRFAIGLRAPLYFAGGSLGYPLLSFVLLDLVGLVLTVPLTLVIGRAFGAEAAEGLKVALGHQRVVLAVVVAAGLGWWAWKSRKRVS
jgi:membrane protein DedA with SNARE-associated domain